MPAKSPFAASLLALLLLGAAACLRPAEPGAPSAEETEERGGPKSPEARAEAIEERWQFEFDLLKDPATGQIPENARALSLAQAYRAPDFAPSTRNASFGVVSRGPNNRGGRTRALAFDLRYNGSSNQILLAGGVSSGLFKSSDSGLSWNKVSSNDEIHNVTTLAQDPRPGFQDIWYYATGEWTGNSASLGGGTYRGNGVWKSTDNGDTWAFLGNSNTGALEAFDSNTDYCMKIAVHPLNGHVYLAALGQILRSQDGGASWQAVLGPGGGSANQATDLVISSGGQLYAAFAGTLGSSDDGVWASASGDPGAWTRIASSGLVSGWNASGNYGRCVLALAPSNESKLFALYYNNSTSNCSSTPAPEAELFVYNAATAAWADLSANLPNEPGCSNGNDPFAVQGGYDLVVAVRPDNENVVFVGGTNVYRSTTGFTTSGATTRIGGYANTSGYNLYFNHHPDIHALVFPPNNPGLLYTGTDGGLHRADISAASVSWTSLNNNYVTYQYYHAAIDPATGSDYVIGGAQDNGTTESNGGPGHVAVFGGDGVAVGVASPSLRYYGSQRGNITRNSVNIKPSGSGSGIFVTYFHLDPDNTNLLYYASNDALYRTSSASTVGTSGWTQLSGVTGTLNGNIRSLASTRGGGYSASDPSRKLYIGTEDGQIYRLSNPAYGASATAPANITPAGAGGGIVSSIALNPANDEELLVTYSNYGIPSVFHTLNGGSATPSWTQVEGNISQASFRSSAILTESGTTYYIVGTSVGLYCSSALAGGATQWSRIGASSIGFAVVSSLALRPSDNFLLAGTHGNGMFMVEPPRSPVISFRSSASSSLEESRLPAPDCRRYRDYSIPLDISQAPAGDATVSFSLATGNAAEGRDYDILNPGQQIVFPNGSAASQNLLLRVYDDSQDEPDETLTLTFLVSGTTDAIVGSTSFHTHTIYDEDLAPDAGTVLMAEGFESDFSFGPFTSSGWALGIFNGAPGLNQWQVGPNGGLSGNGSAYISRDGFSPGYDNSSSDDVLLRSALINASGHSGLSLRFDFACAGESGYDYGQLYYSFDGTNFTLIEGSSSAPYVGQPTTATRTVALPGVLDGSSFYLGWRWINDNIFGTNPAWKLDNVILSSSSPGPVEVQLAASGEAYLGPWGRAAFYDGQELIAFVQNTSNHDYGCITALIDRAGTGSAPFWNASGTANDLASKTLLITPENNDPAGSYTLTLYYSAAEVAGWEAASGKTWGISAQMVKSPGAIANVSPGNPYPDGTIDVVSGTKGSFGSNYYLTASFSSGFSGFGVGDPGSPVSLPVEWLAFEAQALGGQVRLDWATASEENSAFFAVERSADGQAFGEIGRVAAAGSSSSPRSYQFWDAGPLPGRSYYRLRATDQDGSFHLSNLASVYLQPPSAFVLSCDAGQALCRIRYEGSESLPASVVFYTYEGRALLSHAWQASPGVAEALPLGGLARGIYLYEIQAGGKRYHGKLRV